MSFGVKYSKSFIVAISWMFLRSPLPNVKFKVNELVWKGAFWLSLNLHKIDRYCSGPFWREREKTLVQYKNEFDLKIRNFGKRLCFNRKWSLGISPGYELGLSFPKHRNLATAKLHQTNTDQVSVLSWLEEGHFRERVKETCVVSSNERSCPKERRKASSELLLISG